jgi:4-aminobutyrate aminotransferase-like enzyme
MDNKTISESIKRVNTGEFSSIGFEKVEGNTLIDFDGNEYLDFSSGYGVTNAGWHRKKVIESIKNQMDKLSHSTLAYPTLPALQLSEMLLKIMPEGFSKCARAVGGADANEIIFKASIAYNGKKKVLSLDRGYHGGTKSAVSISSKKFNLPRFPSLIDYVHAPTPFCHRCPLGKKKESCNIDCALMIDDILRKDKEIGLFIMEPVIGSGGAIAPPKEYYCIVQEICKRHNVTFAFDEVITGFGRIGALTAMEKYGIVPDAVSFAKGLSGGMIPIAATLLNKNLAESIEKYQDVTGTFAWTPLACAAAITNIEVIIEENLPGEANEKGNYLKSKLWDICNKTIPDRIGDIRGDGLLIGVELKKPDSDEIDFELTEKLYDRFIKNGLMVSSSWLMDVIILMPPLNISFLEIDRALRIIEDSLKKI